MTRLIFSSFCRADEKLYRKLFFSLPNGKTQKSEISKHEHVHAKLYLKTSKFCMYTATFGLQNLCLLGACLWNVWVQSMRKLGACLWNGWVQSMRLLGASLWILWVHVCGFWVHVYGSAGCMYAVVGCMPDSR